MPPANRRLWLPYPPATIRPPLSCGSGLPRFARLELARAALTVAVADAGLAARECEVCQGAHLVPVPAAQPASDGLAASEGRPGPPRRSQGP